MGSSGRVFPEGFRATALLRAWLGPPRRPRGDGCARATRWCGWTDDGALAFNDRNGAAVVVAADACVLALGGASWPSTGSDGTWVGLLEGAGVEVTALRSANCGVVTAWTDVFRDRFAGTPLKDVRVRHGDATARGDLVVTRDGIEGGPVYALSAALRGSLEDRADVRLELDLLPDASAADVEARLARRRSKDSAATGLARAGLAPVAVGLLREATANRLPADSAGLGALVRAVPIHVTALQPLARAISTAGGVALAGGRRAPDAAGPAGHLRGRRDARLGGADRWLPAAGRVQHRRGGRGGRARLAGYGAPVTEPAMLEIVDGATTWRFDVDFLESRWTCLYGRGCLGILAEPAEHLGQGCCSVGAELDGEDEARTIGALAATLDPDRFEHHADAAVGGIYVDGARGPRPASSTAPASS